MWFEIYSDLGETKNLFKKTQPIIEKLYTDTNDHLATFGVPWPIREQLEELFRKALSDIHEQFILEELE